MLSFIFGGMPGYMEMLIIAFIVLLLFGNRLPSVMRSLGKGVVEFKKGLNDMGDDDEAAIASEEDEKASTEA
ncbi:MAG: twin-arginine translocase TatA/TatE family subunit [Planctomycetota bacterium]|nr:MAG: twin-arginine translocase TatA/TatE family subunit [Planctomycetota bacterium]